MAVGRKILVVLVASCLLAIGTFVWSAWGQRYEVVLTEQQILEKLNEKLPFTKTYFLLFELEFLNPTLNLEEGSDRIAFGCDIQTKIKLETDSEKIPGPLRGSVKLSGLLRYESTAGEFFLDQPRVENIDVAGIPEKWRAKVAAAASKAVAEFLSRSPLYKLKPTDVKKAAARLILRDVKVSDRKLTITLGVG